MPEAPTSVPLMMSALLLEHEPGGRDRQSPVNELSSEITTGMSAPPIGITMSTPNASAHAEQRVERAARRRAEPRAQPIESPAAISEQQAVDDLLQRRGDRRSRRSGPAACRTPPRCRDSEIEPMMQPNMVEVGRGAVPGSPAWRVQELGRRDERRRAAAAAVQERHHLRHVGHRAPRARPPRPAMAPMRDAASDQAAGCGCRARRAATALREQRERWRPTMPTAASVVAAGARAAGGSGT